MRKITPFLLFACILMTIVSCQKEESLDTLGGKSSTGFAEVGTWKLLSIKATASQTTEFKDGTDDVKMVTVRDFTSTGNGGTIKLSGSIMTATALTFAIDTITRTYFYINGALDDMLDVPFAVVLPPTDLMDGYTKLTTDSLYFQTGMLSTIISGGTQTEPTGFKLAFNGDKMIMTSVTDKIKSGIGQGAKKVFTHEESVITLQKQ